jgi:hypothetical protein
MKTKGIKLGEKTQNGHKYEYYKKVDNYVYQWIDGTRCNGWFCSFVSWENALHKVLEAN